MQGLYALKPWYTRRLGAIVGWARRGRISPDVFTAVGVLGAALAAVAIWWGWWPLALIFLALRLAGANLDGAVARDRGVARPWGFVLNEIGDRSSDLLMFVGLWLLAARVHDPGSLEADLVLVAALCATLPTFASLSAAGAGGVRRNGGPFGKTERCLVAVLAAALPQWLIVWALLIVAGSLLTAILRLAATSRDLANAA